MKGIYRKAFRLAAAFLFSLSLIAVPTFVFAPAALADAPNPANTDRQPAQNYPAGGSDESYNWAGYIAEQGTYTGVNGSWIIPTVSAGSNLASDATWVGIGGVKSTDLIQAGTQAIVQNGGVQYQAWYELLPQTMVTAPLVVRPGDSVSASLLQLSNGEWQIAITDNTTGQNFTTQVAYNSSLSSAEWIEEMPSLQNGTFLPLDDFGSISFINAMAMQNGSSMSLSQVGAQPITMLVQNGQALAAPSAIAQNENFTVTRSAVSAASIPQTTLLQSSRRHGIGMRRHGVSIVMPNAPQQIQILPQPQVQRVQSNVTPNSSNTSSFSEQISVGDGVHGVIYTFQNGVWSQKTF